MSKALFGHLGGSDPRLLAEVTRLRSRVGELERENEELRARLLIDGPALAGEVGLEEVALDGGLALDRPTLDRPAPALA